MKNTARFLYNKMLPYVEDTVDTPDRIRKGFLAPKPKQKAVAKQSPSDVAAQYFKMLNKKRKNINGS